MADSEWWSVEAPTGAPIRDSLSNQEQAEAAASEVACEIGSPLVVVRYTRTEVKRFVRKITVTSEDVTSKA
jgi:hypothetical protein